MEGKTDSRNAAEMLLPGAETTVDQLVSAIIMLACDCNIQQCFICGLHTTIFPFIFSLFHCRVVNS